MLAFLKRCFDALEIRKKNQDEIFPTDECIYPLPTSPIAIAFDKLKPLSHLFLFGRPCCISHQTSFKWMSNVVARLGVSGKMKLSRTSGFFSSSPRSTLSHCAFALCVGLKRKPRFSSSSSASRNSHNTPKVQTRLRRQFNEGVCVGAREKGERARTAAVRWVVGLLSVFPYSSPVPSVMCVKYAATTSLTSVGLAR